MNAPLRTDFLPPPTRALYERLTGETLLEDMLLVGGSALALQIGHRLSEDLDFATLEPRLRLDSFQMITASLSLRKSYIS